VGLKYDLDGQYDASASAFYHLGLPPQGMGAARLDALIEFHDRAIQRRLLNRSKSLTLDRTGTDYC
jgi:hypothetical protein